MAAYLGAHCTTPDPVVAELMAATAERTGKASMMQIGADQALFTEMLARTMGARSAIEVGTFTGMSALAIARGIGPTGRLICCDVSDEWTSIGRTFWEQAGVADRIDLRLGPALETLAALDPSERFDLAFIDADKSNYANYYEALLPHMNPTGVILVDNTLWFRQVLGDLPDDASNDTRAIRAFNDMVAVDSRVRAVIVPLGDGITMIQPNASPLPASR